MTAVTSRHRMLQNPPRIQKSSYQLAGEQYGVISS